MGPAVQRLPTSGATTSTGVPWCTPKNRSYSEQSAGSRCVRSRTRRTQDAAPGGPERPDPHRAQARVDQDPGENGPRVHEDAEAREERGPAHGLPGGGLPQHLRVLGGPRGHLPHRRRPVHAALRLLPDRHRQARGARPRRAPPGRRVRRHDGPELRHHHRRRPRRPGGRRRLAVRRDGPPDPPADGGPRGRPHQGRAARPGLQRRARAARRGLLLAPRGLRAQRRDGPADLQAHPSGLPLRALAEGHHRGPRRTAWSRSRT